MQSHCINYARMRVSLDSYSPVYAQNLRFCPYTEVFGSVETRILTSHMQCRVFDTKINEFNTWINFNGYGMTFFSLI